MKATRDSGGKGGKGGNGKAQIKVDDLQFKIDSLKLKELEKRLSKQQTECNDYLQDFSFPVTSLKRYELRGVALKHHSYK